MTSSLRRILWTALLVAALAPTLARAEVTRIEIAKREDVLGGKAWGTVGPYEKLVGKVYFAIDPKNPHNTIADLDKAPKNAQGKVEFSSDIYIIKPKDSSKGNGVLFMDVVNRGNKQLLGSFSRARGSADPTTEADFGDGYLLREGYTLVSVGWEFDARGPVKAYLPVATDNGKPITGWLKPWFIPNEPSLSFEFSGGYNTTFYPPLDPKNPDYRLTERTGMVGPQRLIPRDQWSFGKMADASGKVASVGGTLDNDVNWLTLKTGFRAGMTYQLYYESKDPPVAGLGFAAVRDTASYLKNSPNAVAPGKFAFTYGASQTGRWQRDFVYQAFTIDEQNRRAVDALFIQTGGASLGSFNERFAVPNELGSFNQTRFPILYKTTTDPITGKKDGLGARIPAGLEPKIFLVDTGSEYWDRGRVAALRHTSIDGLEDVEDAPNVRVYLLASAQHGSGTFPPPETGGQFKGNSNDYRFAQKALLAGLNAWVQKGTPPPASKHPSRADGTLVQQKSAKFPNIPGVKWPTDVPGSFRSDVPGDQSLLPFMVPQVDADGIDIAGIRLPEQTVPLATYTGWVFRSEKIGAPDTLIAMIGSYIPMPVTKAERERMRDPRLSITERYRTKADYLKKVEDAAKTLVTEHYVLQEDVQPIVNRAAAHWDYVMGGGRTTQGGAAN